MAEEHGRAAETMRRARPPPGNLARAREPAPSRQDLAVDGQERPPAVRILLKRRGVMRALR